jgi:uncharacterized membrane protein YdbT with pleckstrin-like domain
MMGIMTNTNIFQPGEKIRFEANPHWIVLVNSILWAIASTIFFGVAAFLSARYLGGYGYLFLLLIIPSLAKFGWRMLVRGHTFYWVTDLRVIKQEGIFNKVSSEASLSKINNVYYRQTPLGKILNYGEIRLETASEQGITLLDFVPNPEKLKNAVVAPVSAPSAPAVAVAPAADNELESLLQQLKNLKDKGLLTEEEYQAKKAEVLSRV